MIELYEPQKKAVAKQIEALTKYNVALCTANTGTGKTLMALMTAKTMGLIPLIICPIAATATFRKWSNDLGVPVLDVLNIESLRTGKTPYVQLTGPAKRGQFKWRLNPKNHMVCIDEVHRGLTGQQSISGRMCCMLRPQGIKVLMMTATPPATPLGLRNIGYLARLHDFSAASFFRFCREHGCVDSKWHRGLEFDLQSPRAKEAMERINRGLQPIMAKVTVEDIADHFQQNLVEPWLISLSDTDTKVINKIYADMDDELKKEHTNPLVAQLRARQAAELLKLPAIHDAVMDSIEEGNNVFVALGFIPSVEKLSLSLGQAGAPVVRITGELGQEERDSAAALFQSDMSRVLVSTIAAGGLSISLHQTRKGQRPRTSIISPTFSASDLLQCLGRINRAEGLSPTVQRIALVAGSIEEKVARRIESKLSMLSTLTDMDLGRDMKGEIE